MGYHSKWSTIFSEFYQHFESSSSSNGIQSYHVTLEFGKHIYWVTWRLMPNIEVIDMTDNIPIDYHLLWSYLLICHGFWSDLKLKDK